MSKARTQFKAEFGCCMVCGGAWRSADFWPRLLEVHEIVRGVNRAAGVKSEAAWLLLCRQHHEQCGDLGKWPVVRQLALKLWRDPARYDRVAVNVMRGRQPEAITEAEVLEALAVLKSELPSI